MSCEQKSYKQILQQILSYTRVVLIFFEIFLASFAWKWKLAGKRGLDNAKANKHTHSFRKACILAVMGDPSHISW